MFFGELTQGSFGNMREYMCPYIYIYTYTYICSFHVDLEKAYRTCPDPKLASGLAGTGEEYGNCITEDYTGTTIEIHAFIPSNHR